MDLLSMSKEELSRLEVMERLQEKRMGQRTAAEILGVSVRHVKRLLRSYRSEGAAGLVSKQPGRQATIN
jgi:transposase